MPRRVHLTVAVQDPSAPQQDLQAQNLAILRTQWRWAAFSQFFFTFFPLFALNDVSVADIEQDLVNNTRHVLPRIMQKLLYTLSYDRKVSVDNWQTALRKQYNRRAPNTNPIGPEPPPSIPLKEHDMGQDVEKGTPEEVDDKSDNDEFLNASEAGVSVVNTVASLGDLTSAAPTPLNDPNSTRQSSVVEDRRVPSTSNDVDGLHSQQKSINWFDLPMLLKLESMHTVAEWHFQNPTRLRTIMKSDDEFATWRIEPIGYDSRGNAYWLIGADRLWIQRMPPKPKTLKRKRPSQKSSEKKETSSQKAKRIRMSPAEKRSATHPTTLTPSSDRHSRAAKDQAKKRLDAQAKELAELNRQAALTSSGSRTQASRRSATTATPLVLGTRSSARLRGAQDDEWQSIPEEWLKQAKPTRIPKRLEVKTGLETDDESVSELTELSEDDSEPSSTWELNGQDYKVEESSEDEHGASDQGASSEDIVEWETICSTLREWEHIAERFDKATHYSEKALYKVLVHDIVPVIAHELREIDRKRQLEEAIVHRKRSSRIALRESEKEVARMAAVKKQEQTEKMSRARRLEARKQREEEERIKKEHARELRRKDREAKDLEVEEVALIQAEMATKTRKSTSPARDSRKMNAQKANGNEMSSGSRTPVGEDWELACEICNRQGINLDDGTPMMSCGICSRWQHIQCHDRADRIAGRPRRNWNSEEFTCSRCRATQRIQYHPATSKQASLQLNVPQGSNSVYQDYRSSSHYLSGYNNPLMPNHHGRPNNGQQYPNAQYPSSLAGHSALSFSHYQPSQHAFFPNAPNKMSHPSVQSVYAHANNSNAFPQHRNDFVSSQISTWTPSVAQSPGNSNAATTSPDSSYLSPQTDHHDLQSVHTYSNHEPQTSYTRSYPTDLSTGYKQAVPYQTSSRQ